MGDSTSPLGPLIFSDKIFQKTGCNNYASDSRLIFSSSWKTTHQPRNAYNYASYRAAVTAPLPEKLVQARQLKQRGLLASGIFLTCGLLTASALGLPLPQLPHPPSELQNAAAAIVGTSVLLVTAVGVKKGAEDTLAVEWHNGRLYLQMDVPPRGGPALPRDAIEVTCFYC